MTAVRETTRDRVYGFIRTFIADNHYAPSMQEIGDALGISTVSAVSYHLDILEREKKIKRTPTISRSIRVVGSCPVCGCDQHE